MRFHKEESHGFIRKDDFNTLIGACHTIGHAFYDNPTIGITVDDHDYVPVDVLEETGDILEAITIILSYIRSYTE